MKRSKEELTEAVLPEIPVKKPDTANKAASLHNRYRKKLSLEVQRGGEHETRISEKEPLEAVKKVKDPCVNC